MKRKKLIIILIVCFIALIIIIRWNTYPSFSFVDDNFTYDNISISLWEGYPGYNLRAYMVYNTNYPIKNIDLIDGTIEIGNYNFIYDNTNTTIGVFINGHSFFSFDTNEYSFLHMEEKVLSDSNLENENYEYTIYINQMLSNEEIDNIVKENNQIVKLNILYEVVIDDNIIEYYIEKEFRLSVKKHSTVLRYLFGILLWILSGGRH